MLFPTICFPSMTQIKYSPIVNCYLIQVENDASNNSQLCEDLSA